LEIAPSNLVWRAGQQADEQLYQGQVLVITDLAGFHSGFRQGSGAFSLQAEGELWSGGEKQKCCIGLDSGVVVPSDWRWPKALACCRCRARAGCADL
jgi:hypothetical protein